MRKSSKRGQSHDLGVRKARCQAAEADIARDGRGPGMRAKPRNPKHHPRKVRETSAHMVLTRVFPQADRAAVDTESDAPALSRPSNPAPVTGRSLRAGDVPIVRFPRQSRINQPYPGRNE